MMKKFYIISILLSLPFIFSGCEKNIISINKNVDNTTLISYCRDNGGYAAIEDDMVSCYFEDSYCNALDFYNGECYNEPYVASEFDELLAKNKCESVNGSVESVNAGGEEINLCFFQDGSVCSLEEIFDGSCIIEGEEYLID